MKKLSFLALFLFLLPLSGFSQKKKDKDPGPAAPDTLQPYFQKCAENVKNGMAAPPFKYVNSRGDSVALADFKGKYVVLDIWATWCAPCIAEIPFLDELKLSFRTDNVVFVSIAMDEERETWKKFILKKRLTGIQLWGGKNAKPVFNYTVQECKKLNMKCKGLWSGIPAFVIIGPDGKIVNNFAPYPSQEDELEKLLSGLPGLKKK